ncbi:Cthe_2314 family HEPN domain-containing protein [Bacillus safensis]|uniref:Cthe_2314 family HEPN domain-containing protein n=2 Tax=Bacillus safensis TaxID=561879 RepID=UPI0022822DC1|nr:Cthe_2314 family HEPN domain-containing protein [Bacillus safensis]MCY7584603.1 Cthe_2314 family HEPN domain-containing protein [Bacillus safensis]MCY7587474.1 Cthe_2314 family HEPN domain-containing protein [Bacillus safensis]
MNFLEHLDFPTVNDWNGLFKDKKKSFDRIILRGTTEEQNIFEFMLRLELESWINLFNNRVHDLQMNYVMLKFFYRKGIPDDVWNISPGSEGQSVEYFPNFKEEHYSYHYWFGSYVKGYYTEFIGIVDTIYHLINIKFRYDLEPGMHFNKEVIRKLYDDDKELFHQMKRIRKNSVFKQVNDYRNNLIHNYSQMQVSSGISRINLPDGGFRIEYGVGDYTKTKEYFENIESSIDFLASIVEKIRMKIT